MAVDLRDTITEMANRGKSVPLDALAIEQLGMSIETLANVIYPPGVAPNDGVESLSEAVVKIADGLRDIASAINEFTEAYSRANE